MFFSVTAKNGPSPCPCPGKADKVCNHFVPVKDKNSDTLYPTVMVSLELLMIVVNIAMTGLMSDRKMLVPYH